MAGTNNDRRTKCVNAKDALKAIARIAAGEAFADVSREVSVDALSKANGGDLGWIPRGVVPYDDVVFQLEVGQISSPVMIDPSNPAATQYAVFLVLQKEPNRNIETYMMQVLSYRAFYNWLEREMLSHVIEYDYGPETQTWVNGQLAEAKAR